ncbi:sigma E protease regulator RseP [Phytohalomonas tamaricis]|uniref:sigma E protease regulator RseP n=1 Tax=Phytohalomonas tamaricis TaxID=2081032 RepID=UPI000D0B5518|nr:sigma E protease regulator RseP [Phytohalomonas tamaricis]
MSALQNILAVIVVLGLLVTIHEFGHFWVARRCGVKVLRFSVGFGKPFWSRTDRHGTEYALAAIPLGGYVKMLDEREGDVPPEQLEQAFNRQSVWKRIAIVSAGPIANFLLALVAYWVMFIYGASTVAPVIGQVSPDSPAARSGLEPGQEIVAVNDEKTPSWSEVNLKLVAAIGASQLDVTVRDEQGQGVERHRVAVRDFMARQDPPQPLATLGITPWQPETAPVIGEVIDEGRAATAGLQKGDRIIAVNDHPLDQWATFVEQIREHPDVALTLTIERDGQRRQLSLTPDSRNLENGQTIGYIGAAAEPGHWPEKYLRELRYGPLEAIGQAAHKTGEMTLLTFDSIRKMLIGLISPSNLSGPITIARVAGDSARSGFETFIGFLAYLSISLGVLNLLPVPVLDGGHLLYYFVEVVRGRPLSERTQAAGLRIGVALVGTLMLMAFYFDLMRL